MELTKWTHHACLLLQSCISNSRAELASFVKLKWILVSSTRKAWELKWICILKLQLKMYTWKKKYGWKLAAKRVNTDWDNGTKPLLILYFEHVPFAQSILHLFCCSKEEQNKIPLRCHFVSQYQLKWRTMIWPKLPILFDCKKIVLTRNLNNCAPIPVYTVPTLTCKPFITPYKVLIRES